MGRGGQGRAGDGVGWGKVEWMGNNTHLFPVLSLVHVHPNNIHSRKICRIK